MSEQHSYPVGTVLRLAIHGFFLITILTGCGSEDPRVGRSSQNAGSGTGDYAWDDGFGGTSSGSTIGSLIGTGGGSSGSGGNLTQGDVGALQTELGTQDTNQLLQLLSAMGNGAGGDITAFGNSAGALVRLLSRIQDDRILGELSAFAKELQRLYGDAQKAANSAHRKAILHKVVGMFKGLIKKIIGLIRSKLGK